MLPIGSIFFPLRVAHFKIENNFQGRLLQNRQIKITPKCQCFKITERHRTVSYSICLYYESM